MSDKLKFDGGTHRNDPFTPEELAAQRERNDHYDRNFLSADDFVNQMGLRWLVNMAQGVPAFAKMFAFFSALFGIIALLKHYGAL